jgi:DNA-binding transcriptional LysR family regulator
MVAAGAGITFLPLLALEIRPFIVNKRLTEPMPQREIAILWRKASFVSSCCEKLVQVITTVILSVLSDLEKQL